MPDAYQGERAIRLHSQDRDPRGSTLKQGLPQGGSLWDEARNGCPDSPLSASDSVLLK